MIRETAVGNKFTGGLLTVNRAPGRLPSKFFSPAFGVLCGIQVRADLSNTSNIFIAQSYVSASTGYKLEAGESQFIPLTNLEQLYFNTQANGQKLWYWIV